MSNESEAHKEQPITIRFPLDVLVAVKALAKQHERSFNGEVIWALRDYLERHTSKTGR